MYQDELPIASFEMPTALRAPQAGEAPPAPYDPGRDDEYGRHGGRARLDAPGRAGHPAQRGEAGRGDPEPGKPVQPGQPGEPGAGDPGQQMQVYHIRLANSAGRREAASLLIRKMYGWRGYAFEPSLQHDPNKVTLYAETGGELVGTMSLCLDSEFGLPADDNFRDKLDFLRGQGRRLCEPSRLAIDKGVSKRVFAALIHISYLYSHKLHGFTDYVIEVNPRHVMFYKRMLGFSDFGGERPCPRVGAPAVLLRLPLEAMGVQIRKWGGLMEQHGEERSFYPYFFPVWDEPGISARLRGEPH